MTEEERAEVIEYYKKGYKVAEIRLLLPLNTYELQAVFREQKAKGTERQKQARGQKAIILSNPPQSNESAQQYAQRLNVGLYSVYKHTNIGKAHPHPNSRTQAIIDDLQQGTMTLAEIGRKHGVSRQAVFKCKKYL